MTWRAIPVWPDASALFDALGVPLVKQTAAWGDGEAQFSYGCLLVNEADGYAGLLGASGRSPIADVGLALAAYLFRVAHRTEARRCGYLPK
jgi:hypothetical protein